MLKVAGVNDASASFRFVGCGNLNDNDFTLKRLSLDEHYKFGTVPPAYRAEGAAADLEVVGSTLDFERIWFAEILSLVVESKAVLGQKFKPAAFFSSGGAGDQLAILASASSSSKSYCQGLWPWSWKAWRGAGGFISRRRGAAPY